MFSITSGMLLESADSLFGDVRIANSKITNENYFDTALEAASSIEAEYTDAKAKLYNGLVSSTKEFKDMFSTAYARSFPKKDEKYVGESCTSTEHFISFFGKSIEILNKAAGNIADSCSGICNQVPVVTKEAVKVIGKQEKTDLCPVCKAHPCTCTKMEQLFKFTTDHGINITDFNFPKMDDAIAGKDDFKSLYDSMVVEAVDIADKRRGALSGLSQPIDMSIFGEAVVSNFRSTNRYPARITHRYLDYCIETVNSYSQRVNEMKVDVKRIANHYHEAANKISNVMTASSTMEYIKEDGNAVYLEGDECVQNMDLYCKAKVDELVAGCMEHIICIGAKLDAMKCEYDQCKAILSKYICGNDEPIAVPRADVSVSVVPRADEHEDDDDDSAPASDGTTTDGGAIQEDPNADVDYSAEYESYMPGMLDIGDTRDMEEYNNSYAAFLSDMITHEAQLSSYINGEVLAESDTVFVEGAIGKTKGLLHRIGEFIKKIWAKFKNAMAGLFQNDQKYLAANENTIKNVKPKSAKIDQWYNYDRNLIVNDNTLSNLNKTVDGLLAPGVFIKNGANNANLASCGDQKNGMANTFNLYFKQCDNPKENNTMDKFRTYFRKYPVSINANTLTDKDRAEMYDYCFDFKQSVQDKLQEDIDAADEMSSQADQAIQELMNAVDQNEAREKAEKEKQEQQNVNDGIAGNPVNAESALDMYFSEAEYHATQENPPSNSNTQGTAAKNAFTPSQNTDSINKINTGVNKDVATGKVEGATKANAEIVQRFISNVFTLTREYTSVKLSMAQNAYQQYMQFFRWHVGQYAGTDKQQQQGGTNIDTSQATVNNGEQQQEENGGEASNEANTKK